MERALSEFILLSLDRVFVRFLRNGPCVLQKRNELHPTFVKHSLNKYMCASCKRSLNEFYFTLTLFQICQLDFITVLRDITQEMNRIIDFDQSITLGRIASRPGLDPTLDRSKSWF